MAHKKEKTSYPSNEIRGFRSFLVEMLLPKLYPTTYLETCSNDNIMETGIYEFVL